MTQLKWIFPLLAVSLLLACASRPDVHRNIYFKRSWSRDTVSDKYMGHRHPATIQPVVLDKIVVSGNSIDGIRAFQRKSGRGLWRLDVKNGSESVYADDRSGVFMGSNNGKFHQIDAETGAQGWSYSLNSESTSAPLVQGGFVFHMAMNGTFYCMERESGRVLWVKTRPPKDNITIRGTTQPLFSDGKVYVGYSDGYFVAYSAADGSMVWERQLSDNKKFNDIDARPAVTSNCVAVANYSDSLFCLDPATGATKWQLTEGGSYQPIQVSGNDIVYSTESSIMLVDSFSGKARKRWDIDKKWGQPTSAIPYKKWLIFGLSEGPLVLMDKDTGHWDDTFTPGRGITASPTVIPETNEVYITSNQANVYRLDIVTRDWRKTFPWGAQ